MDEEHFYKNKGNSIDGLQPNCIIHLKEITYNWQIQNSEIYRKKMHQRNINPSMKTKQYWKEKEKKRREDGKTLEWQRNNKDKIKQYNKKRTGKKHEITKQEWIDCKNYFNNCCAYCGLPLDKHIVKFKGELIHSDFHKEHLDDDGVNDLSNCIPSCKQCNSQKWNFDFDEWYNKDNLIYSQERYDKILKWINEDYKLYIEEEKPKRKYIKKAK